MTSKNECRCHRTWKLTPGAQNSPTRVEFVLVWDGVMTEQDCMRLSAAIGRCFDLAKGLRKVTNVADSEPTT